MITNTESGTNLHEVAAGIYRINTPIATPGGPFNFNQYLIDDEEPLLFHTGPRQLFPLVSQAVSRVIPLERLRHVGFSHFEADECGALNLWLAASPQSAPLTGNVGAMVSVTDVSDRAPRVLADGEILTLGRRSIRWFDTPHLPHGWDSGLIMELDSRTLFCGDLFTQAQDAGAPLTESDILGPSEAFRQQMDYFSHAPGTGGLLERLAQERPATLACMHGSAWRGDGAALLRELAASLARA